MIAEDYRGHILEEFIPLSENDLDLQLYEPFTHTQVLAHQGDSFLIILHKWKGHWSLPAGSLEPGETPLDAARRALFEQADLDIAGLRLLGVMKYRMASDDHVEYGALYGGELDPQVDLRSSHQYDTTRLWNRESHIHLSPIDIHLMGCYK